MYFESMEGGGGDWPGSLCSHTARPAGGALLQLQLQQLGKNAADSSETADCPLAKTRLYAYTVQKYVGAGVSSNIVCPEIVFSGHSKVSRCRLYFLRAVGLCGRQGAALCFSLLCGSSLFAQNH